MDAPTRSPIPAHPIDYETGSKTNLGLIVFITSITAIGGLLFGYDTAVISGAVGFLETHFSLTSTQTGWAGASVILGCVPGAMCAGFLSDRFGRKTVLILCAVIYIVSGVASAIPQTFSQLLMARFFGGLGVGASSMICPVYIAEISPEKHRGRLCALFQLGIVIGIFVVFFTNLLIQRMGDTTWNTLWGWRWMLGSISLPSAVFLVLLLAVPESPRWLAVNGQMDLARRILTKFTSAAAAEKELSQVLAAAAEEEGHFGELFTPAYQRPLLIAVALAIFAQFSGINSVIYYAPEIFKSAGGSVDSAFASTVYIGGINLLFTFVAIACVDRAGRKLLLIIGTAIQALSLAAAGLMFHIGHKGPGVLICLMAFIAAFAMAMGPIPWIMISEIFPGRIRGRASSVGVFTIWAADCVVAFTFPVLNKSLGGARTFWIYGICSLASMIFVLLFLPETKGRTLEEIEASWKHGA